MRSLPEVYQFRAPSYDLQGNFLLRFVASHSIYCKEVYFANRSKSFRIDFKHIATFHVSDDLMFLSEGTNFIAVPVYAKK